MSKQKRIAQDQCMQRKQLPQLGFKNIKKHAQAKSQKPTSPKVLWSAPPYIKAPTCINRYHLSPIVPVVPVIVPMITCPVSIAVATPSITYPHRVPINYPSLHKYSTSGVQTDSQEKSNKGCFCNNACSDKISQVQEGKKNFNFTISINPPVSGQKYQLPNNQQKHQSELINQYKALSIYTQTMKKQNQQLKTQNYQLKQLKERIQDAHKDRIKNIREAIDNRNKEIEKQLYDLKRQNKQQKQKRQQKEDKQKRDPKSMLSTNNNIKMQKNQGSNSRKRDNNQDSKGTQFSCIYSHDDQKFENSNNKLKKSRSYSPKRFYVINCCENCTEKVLEKIPQSPQVLYSFKNLAPNYIINNHTFGNEVSNKEVKDQIQTQQTQFYYKKCDNTTKPSQCEQCKYQKRTQEHVLNQARNCSRVLKNQQQQRNFPQEYMYSNSSTPPNNWMVKQCQTSHHQCNNMKTTVKYKAFATPSTSCFSEDQCLQCLQQKYNQKIARLQCKQSIQQPTYLEVENRSKKDANYAGGLVLDIGYRADQRVISHDQMDHHPPPYANPTQQNINQLIHKLKRQNSALRNIKTTYI